MIHTHSEELFRRAQEIIPGGVNSPVRAFRSVGGKPVFIARGQGSHIFDVDGNEYIDYVGSWGPLLLGHRHPAILERSNARSPSAPVSAPPPRRKSNWPKPSAMPCRPSRWCGWSIPAPKPPCRPSAWRADSPAATSS
jgi:hypothetical protein